MDILRSTMVESKFRPKDEEPRSLLDFVDEEGVETMRDALKESIRESRVCQLSCSILFHLTAIQEAQTEFDRSILSFDNDLRALKAAMASSSKIAASQSQTSLESSPIPENLNALEIHAQEMASLLDSLVSHFDLCVNAIRHTEGGFAAVRKAASSLPPGDEPVSVSGVMNTESQNLDDSPLSEEERHEMLQVLENDAVQVNDVVAELKEHLSEMENKHEAIIEHVSYLTTEYNTTISAFLVLESISAHLPSYLMASSDFKLHWEETKMLIQDQLQELESMRLFYENYYASYDGLILEVWRRRQAEGKVKAIMKKAMDQVEKVVEADMREREAFRSDVGDFLPGDLWSGVGANPPKWEFGLLGANNSEFVGNEFESPDLDMDVVKAARKRDAERQRLER
jgi:autophagy-related protein 17